MSRPECFLFKLFAIEERVKWVHLAEVGYGFRVSVRQPGNAH